MTFPLERGVLVLIGDAKTIKQQLEGIDLPAPLDLDEQARKKS